MIPNRYGTIRKSYIFRKSPREKEVTPYFPDIGSHPIDSTTLIDSSLPSNHHKSLSYVLPTLMEAKKQSTQLNQPQQPPQQLAVSTAQPATSISTQGSSTSGVTNEPEEHIDPDYLHYLRAIGAYDSFQQQSERGKGRGRKKNLQLCHLFNPLHPVSIIQLLHISKQLHQNLNMSQVFWDIRHKMEPSLTSPKRVITMKIKRPSTQQTKIVISVAVKTISSGHLIHETVRDMEYMLGYQKIDFD
ncbi:hypothetical protein YC2023_008138 [Brassica napus]